MRDIPADLIAAFESAVFRPIFLVEIEFDTPLRFSSVFSEMTLNGITYVGAGNLGNVSSHKENSDLDPLQREITLTGVDDAVLQAVGGNNYINRDVVIRVALLDENGAVIGNTSMVDFIGKTDEVRVRDEEEGAITVIARDRLADWARPRIERNVNADHQARYPGDKGFEFVSQVASKKIIWPKGEYYK